jgi:hypothetical protein
MIPRLKGILTSRWFLTTASIYVLLWIATHGIGAPQVRKLIRDWGRAEPSWVQVPRPHDAPDPPYIDGAVTYYCEVVSYIPFVITARYGVTLGDEAGLGFTAVYFWFGRPSRPYYLYQWAV